MLVCSICSSPFPFHRPCDQVHASLCHDCHLLNMAGETPILALSPRQVQAMRRVAERWAHEEDTAC